MRKWKEKVNLIDVFYASSVLTVLCEAYSQLPNTTEYQTNVAMAKIRIIYIGSGMWPEYSVLSFVHEMNLIFHFSFSFTFYTQSKTHSTLDFRHFIQSNILLLAVRCGCECLMRFYAFDGKCYARCAHNRNHNNSNNNNNNNNDKKEHTNTHTYAKHRPISLRYVRFQSGSAKNNKKYAHSPISFSSIRSQNARH